MPTTTDPDTLPADPLVGNPIGTESSLSNWAGPYVTDMLGKGQALSQQPYQAYTGPLTAGTSSLQDNAFAGIAGLTLPGGYDTASGMATTAFDTASAGANYNPNTVSTSMWDNNQANAYMNPYIQNALNPQLDEMRRQSEITNLGNNARSTQAGSFGGSRQAITNTEEQDNMMRLMAELTGKGYANAYDSAGRMFNTDQERLLNTDQFNEKSNQFGANLGLQAAAQQLAAARGTSDIAGNQFDDQRDIYGDQLNAGGIDRGITAEGIAADKSQFEEERDFPFKQVQYQHSLLGGMPLAAQNSTYGQPSTLSQILSGFGGASDIWDTLFGGNNSDSDIDNLINNSGLF